MTASIDKLQDGIHAMVPYEKMADGAKKIRDFYARIPNAPIVMREFGYYVREKWIREGHISEDTKMAELFGFDPPGQCGIGQLGWCEAAFSPAFETKVIEDRGDYEVVQDHAGRHVLCFKNRRQGFMPEYLDHPVKDMETWEKNCKWRLDPGSSERHANLDKRMDRVVECAHKGFLISQGLIGGYMYLRSLIGPGDLLFTFYDQPELIHDCMETWLQLADSVIAKHQTYVSLDEVFFAEDICYNHGPLISPDMIREFLFPYYKRLLDQVRDRQIDRDRQLFIQVDTDGFATPVIPVYQEIGMNVMSPFEVASHCDVVEIGRQFPELVMSGGFDKRILAAGRDAIDREIERIMPVMKERGGYIPTCDHGVPEEVEFEDYCHFRKRLLEFA